MNVAKIHRKLLITESQFYFANISATEARIFMKFKTLALKIVLDHHTKFHKDESFRCRDIGKGGTYSSNVMHKR